MKTMRRGSLTRRYLRHALLWAVTLAAVIGVTQAQAHPMPCVDREALEAKVAAGEFTVAAEGLDGDGLLVRVMVRDGNWLLFVQKPGEPMACILTGGSGWRTIEAPEAPDGDPA